MLNRGVTKRNVEFRGELEDSSLSYAREAYRQYAMSDECMVEATSDSIDTPQLVLFFGFDIFFHLCSHFGFYFIFFFFWYPWSFQ